MTTIWMLGGGTHGPGTQTCEERSLLTGWASLSGQEWGRFRKHQKNRDLVSAAATGRSCHC